MQSNSHQSATVQVLSTQPVASEYTALDEHNAATPATFFGGKPVLHAHFTGARIVLAKRDVDAYSELRALYQGDAGAAAPAQTAAGAEAEAETETAADAADAAAGQSVQIDGVTGFVTSAALVLVGKASIEVPYHAISLHAIQRLPPETRSTSDSSTPGAAAAEDEAGAQPAGEQVVYLQLAASAFSSTGGAGHQGEEGADDDEEEESVELTIIPTGTGAGPGAGTGAGAGAGAADVFAALSRCADLHPDAGELDDLDDANELLRGPALPGTGGWITAENAHEFEADFDAEARFGRHLEPEGEGGDEDGDADGEPGLNGHQDHEHGDADEREAKWRRLD